MTSMNKFHIYPALIISSLFYWVPFTTSFFPYPAKIKTIAQLNTIEPAECGGSRGFQFFPFDNFGGGSDTTLSFDPGFLVSEYPYDSVGPPAQGAYTIANNTSHWEGEALDWLNTGDSNPDDPEGYAMVVNGGSPAGVFMEYTLGVCPSTNYNFGFNALNLYDTLLQRARQPNIDVLIDGVIFYSAGNLPHNGRWVYHEFNFRTLAGVEEITISLANNTFGGQGNVFALDDFFFGPCGPDLLAEEVNPQLRCVGDTIQLSMTVFGSPFDTNYVQWQSSVNQGRQWTNLGSPSDVATFTVEGLPDSVWFRALVANTRMGIEASACRVISNEILIQYNDFNACPNYTFTDVGALCGGNLGANIFPDGEFGAGSDNVLPFDPGISPFYQYQPNPPPNDGFYTITNNTTNWPSFGEGWLDTRDNSPDPEGYFMVVNADSNPGIFYIDTVQVCENTLYEFSADVFNLHQNQPFFVNPNIEFQIDGVSILRSGEVPQDSAWHTYGFTFLTKPGVTELVLSVRNFAPGGQNNVGNDFALDNIRLQPCGPAVTAFEVSPESHCPGDPTEIRAEIGAEINAGFSDPQVLWQISTDGGANWMDFEGPTRDTILLVDALPADAQFRALIAETADQTFLPSCRIESNPVALTYRPLQDCLDIPINVVGDLCDGSLGANGVPDGDFGRDSLLFANALPDDLTNYTYAQDSFEIEGVYTITNKLNYDPCFGLLPDSCWIPLQSPPEDSSGYFMVVNADSEPSLFYKNEVSGLCENTTYQFSADIINLMRTFFYPFNETGTDTSITPNIDFIVGPADAEPELLAVLPAVYNSGDILNDSTWRTFGFTFTVKPGVSSITLALRNNASGGRGNDFALDNITVSVCGPDASIAPYEICNDEALTLEAVIEGDQFADPAIQWLRSQDGGQNWTNVNGATNESLFINSPTSGDQYRYILAENVGNLSEPLCYISSEVDTVNIRPAFVIDLNESICGGGSFSVGDSIYTSSGVYQNRLTATNGCDSLVNLNLAVSDSVLAIINIGLCAGDSFQGIRPNQDTVFFFVSTTASGCDSTLQVNARVSRLQAFSIEGGARLCPGETLRLNAPVDGFYLWSTGETTQSIEVDSAGTYSVSVSDASGCMEEASVEVQASDLQAFTLDDVPILCAGESATLNAPQDGAYRWSTGESSQSITVSEGGTYSLTISDALGCEVSAEVDVRASDLNDPLIIDGATQLCDNDQVILTAMAAGTYRWSTGETTQSIAVAAEGVYSATIADALGCEAIGMIEVFENSLTAVISVEPPACAGDADGRISISDLTGSSGKALYQINDLAPQESPVFNNLSGGSYTVNVIDEAGCSYAETIDMPTGDRIAVNFLQLDKPIRPNDSILLQPIVIGNPVQIAWTPNAGLSCVDCLSPIAKPGFTTTYTLNVASENGCAATASINIEVDNSRRIYFPNVFSPDGQEPDNQYFKVFSDTDVLQINEMAIFDRWGDQVYQAQNFAPGDSNGAWDGTVNGQAAAAGVYVYYAQITFADGTVETFFGDVVLLR